MNTAFSLPISCVALALGALSACSQGSTGFNTSDAGTPVTRAGTGTGVGSSGGGASSGTGTGPSSGGGSGTGSATGGGQPDAGSVGSADASTGNDSGTGSGIGTGNTGDPEPPDMVGMTAAHNAARAAVQPAATPALPTMAWASSIAATAQAFTNNCVFADTNNAYGSNAFAGTGTNTPDEVVAAWAGEDAYYDYATNTCASGQQCGHYTQVVWRDSVGLGCGMTNCTVNNPFNGGGGGAWQLWVCNYNPPGNYVGEKPY